MVITRLGLNIMSRKSNKTYDILQCLIFKIIPKPLAIRIIIIKITVYKSNEIGRLHALVYLNSNKLCDKRQTNSI